MAFVDREEFFFCDDDNCVVVSVLAFLEVVGWLACSRKEVYVSSEDIVSLPVVVQWRRVTMGSARGALWRKSWKITVGKRRRMNGDLENSSLNCRRQRRGYMYLVKEICSFVKL